MQRHRLPWKPAFDELEQAINAEGVHTYPFNAALPIDVGFFVHSGLDSVRMNRHAYLEVMYVYEGATDIQVLDRRFAARPGDLMVIGPDLYHRVVNQPDTDFKLISLNFDPDVLRTDGPGGEAEQYLLPFTCQTDRFPHHIPRSASLSARALELILQVHNELPATARLGRLAVMTYLKMLLLLLCKHYNDHVESRRIFDCNGRGIERLGSLFEFLEVHLDRPIAVGEAARICAMSSSHFMSFFKKATGQSFVAYLNSFRIAKAQALLSTTNEPIAEISAQLAYCSQSYFGKVFHSLVGMTPLAYRERFRSKSQTVHGAHGSGPVPVIGPHRDYRPQPGYADTAAASLCNPGPAS